MKNAASPNEAIILLWRHATTALLGVPYCCVEVEVGHVKRACLFRTLTILNPGVAVFYFDIMCASYRFCARAVTTAVGVPR